MMKLKVTALAIAAATFATYSPAKADVSEETLDLSAYTEESLPQDVYEELGSLNLEGIDEQTLAEDESASDELALEGEAIEQGLAPEIDARRHGRPGWRHRHPGRGRIIIRPGHPRRGRVIIRPGYPGRGRVIIRPGHPRGQNVCFAKNGRGIVFRAAGYASRMRVQNTAMRVCRANSGRPASCRPMGCR